VKPGYDVNQDGTPNPIKTGVDPVIAQIISSVVALIAGWKSLEPRSERLRMLQRESGQLRLGLGLMYVLPQFLNVTLMLGLIAALLLAFVGALDAGNLLPALSHRLSLRSAEYARAVYHQGWALVLAAILAGIVIYTDLFVRITVLASRGLGFLPIPRLRGRFGPDGNSVSWHQARELLRNQGKAQLLWTDPRGVERVSVAVLEKLAANANSGQQKDRAATPSGTSPGERANLALFGCIIEQIETELEKSPARRWDMLYAALAEASSRSTLFQPGTLREHNMRFSWAQRIRDEVNPILLAGNQPPLRSMWM
jgi:hypothetical protein